MSSFRELRNIALIGFMGTGKSSVGRLAAAELGFALADTDELIESRSGRRISDIFAQQGEAHFRELERQLVTEMTGWSRTVISTGGGLGANEAHLTALKQHAFVVCLWASPEKIFERVRHQSHRPLLQDPNPLEKIRQMLATREPVYRQADVLVNTEVRSLREVAHQIVHQFRYSLTHPLHS